MGSYNLMGSYKLMKYDNIVDDFLNSFKIRSKKCFYDCDEDPEKIAFNGKCRIFVPAFMYYNIKGYTSKILNKPTYRQIFNICCDAYIKKSGNMNDIFFTEIFLPDNNMDNVEYDPSRNFDETFKLMCQPFILDKKKVYDIEMRMEDMGHRLDNYIEKNNIKIHRE
jgi:hypothetical protein